MFVEAIEKAARFTRAIHTISRNYGSTTIQKGAATMFFVNSEGWALTCRHVADVIAAAEQLGKKKRDFQKELEAIRGKKNERSLRRNLESQAGYTPAATYEIYNSFHNCVDKMTGFEVRVHPTLDMALIHFDGFSRLLCDEFPTFTPDDGPLPGATLCRLGFPFAEFSNFAYDPAADTIGWTDEGRPDTPRFPIEGMVTRRLVVDQQPMGFEMSTPGLRGQSGGPVFDTHATVWGMQCATAHLDLDFDVNQEVLRQGKKKKISDSAFLHVGHCIGAGVLKAFMQSQNVSFRQN